jgi:hypothetical protein
MAICYPSGKSLYWLALLVLAWDGLFFLSKAQCMQRLVFAWKMKKNLDGGLGCASCSGGSWRWWGGYFTGSNLTITV